MVASKEEQEFLLKVKKEREESLKRINVENKKLGLPPVKPRRLRDRWKDDNKIYEKTQK